ncbi:hypothetical protein [Consotaella aegiceratis]|uniref:hypothetical protein n=1 Tax=Consotaella aegiceratis TaxID=3097961 RepID=UPI002F3F6A3A
MALDDIQKVSATAQHLIVEYTSTESLANMVGPSVKTRGITVAKTQHLQIMRYVYTLVEAEDVYFEGRRLDHMPGIREFVTEWLKPGEQITSRPNGNYSVLHAYTGKKNVVVAIAMQKKLVDIATPFIDLIGDDPAPEKVLYGNPMVPFVQRGELPPIAAAYYNTHSRRFEVIESPRRARLLPDFLRRFGNKEALVG